MDTTLFLGGKEKTTLEEISKMLGKETIDMFNTSVTKGNQESHGQNFQKLGKELMSVDDLVLLYQLLHRSYKKHWKYSVFWLLGTAVKMGFSVTSK
ncbi:MAG: TraG/TraD/VirD4 family protein, partial [Oscillospiraceae bacterium]|nr:TraG/TraD/VirD4 family protein [Oscillospiraceae bacterium]MCL2278723.1 TraG/TraD/VirD4 family protein [Oscillospiraceae bacterium]